LVSFFALLKKSLTINKFPAIVICHADPVARLQSFPAFQIEDSNTFVKELLIFFWFA